MSYKGTSVICIKDYIKNVNLVIGCNIGCPYCYARMNNRRFHTTDNFNVPSFYESKLKMMDNKKYGAYLLTGQSDYSQWEKEWFEKTFERMRKNPDTQFIFLSKRPDQCRLTEVPDNAWFGVTVTSSKEKWRIDELKKNVNANHYLVTFEPLFDDVGKLDLTDIEWVVIGTETGNRRNKSVSRREWVYNILHQAKDKGIPVFMKDALYPVISEKEMVQEYPEVYLR
jgi:radical SAM mobile pair protein A